MYNPFSSSYNSLGVKSTDDNNDDCAYLNSDHAGTPENMKANLKAGGTGGGGSNYTGSLCSSKTVPDLPVSVQNSTWGAVKTLYR